MAVSGQAEINNTQQNAPCFLFKQINPNKSKVASADFAKRLVGWSQSSLIAFLQEPATTTRGLLESIPPGAKRYAAVKPRAAIVATKEVSLWSLPAEFTSSDVVACLWETGNDQFPEVVLISVYADITTMPISSELANVINYCGRRNLPSITGADTNAHSVIWGAHQQTQEVTTLRPLRPHMILPY
jgi:hypothetical protein